MADIKVLSSIATREAYLELVPQFERASGHTITTTWAGTVDIMKRMAAGETHELGVLTATRLARLEVRVLAEDQGPVGGGTVALRNAAGRTTNVEAFREGLASLRCAVGADEQSRIIAAWFRIAILDGGRQTE